MTLAWTMGTTFQPRRNKYRAKKTVIDNIVFDSRREAERYAYLKLLFRAGRISELTLQPEFPFHVGDKRVFTYRADFSYFENGQRVIEDSKGFKTPVYRLKKKIIEEAFKIQIVEV